MVKLKSNKKKASVLLSSLNFIKLDEIGDRKSKSLLCDSEKLG
jgi:hypothetical protein